MQLSIYEKQLAKIVSYGAALVTIFLIDENVTDPVNAPKLVVLGTVSSAALFIVFASEIRTRLKESKPLILLVLAFLVFAIHSTLRSESPLSQNVYGSYGRNNGFLTYLFLSIIFLVATTFRSKKSIELLPIGLLLSGFVNIVYCLWVIMFGDFLNWTNPYGNILGTLGNPNFIGSFLGLVFTVGMSWVLNPNLSKTLKLSLVPLLCICAFEIVESQAIQGRVVALFGTSIVIFFFLRSRFNTRVLTGYVISIATLGTFSLLGALQIGPLTEYIYKNSVSLRGQYWLAAWNSGQLHPFDGVGMDAFGDWYRRSRDVHALELPGVNTVVNAAHNVPLDFFAFGGWPLFVSYCLVMLSGLLASLKVVRRTKDFDPVFCSIFAAWAGYQLQSLISINQIGLAIWGWLLSGALISYERITKPVEASNLIEPRNRLQRSTFHPRVLIASMIGICVGLALSLPPLTSDMKWRSAQKTRALEPLESSLKASYFNPQNSIRYVTNIQSLEQSGLYDLARDYALEAVRWNPESFDLWRLVYLIKNTSQEEKSFAIKNMQRLDPLNPEIMSTR